MYGTGKFCTILKFTFSPFTSLSKLVPPWSTNFKNLLLGSKFNKWISLISFSSEKAGFLNAAKSTAKVAQASKKSEPS